MKIENALMIFLAIKSELQALKEQKPGDSETLPAIRTRLGGRRKKILITVEDEDK